MFGFGKTKAHNEIDAQTLKTMLAEGSAMLIDVREPDEFAAEHINGKVLWANLFLLFWISLIPFAIRWMDEAHFASMAVASYGVVLMGCAIGYTVLERFLIGANPNKPVLAQAVGAELKGKLSLAAYIAAAPLAFVNPLVAIAIYVSVGLVWFVPDRRIERALTRPGA